MENTINIAEVLKTLGLEKENKGASTGAVWFDTKGEKVDSFSPVDGTLIGSVNMATAADFDALVVKSQEAFKDWKMVPSPKRGEIVRQLVVFIQFSLISIC
jgi:aldehyde dehydrogenase (NAD+)